MWCVYLVFIVSLVVSIQIFHIFNWFFRFLNVSSWVSLQCNLNSKAQWREALERVCLSLWFVCFPGSVSQRVDIFYSYEAEFNSQWLWPLIVTVNLTGFGLAQETHLWVCLWECFKKGSTEECRPILNVSDNHSWTRVPGQRKRRKWAE